MNEAKVQALQAFQRKLTGVIYSAMRRESSRYGMLLARYDQSVMDIREASGLGADCPAYLCDSDLYSHYSDMHKDAHGFRYRGDMTPAQIEASIPYLLKLIEDDGELWAEYDRYLAEEERQLNLLMQEQMELNMAYNTGYDHLDPALGVRA